MTCVLWLALAMNVQHPGIQPFYTLSPRALALVRALALGCHSALGCLSDQGLVPLEPVSKIPQGLPPLEGPSALWAPTALEGAQALVAMTVTWESQSLGCDWLHGSCMPVCDWARVCLSVMCHTACTILLTIPLFCPTGHPYPSTILLTIRPSPFYIT